MNTTEISNYLLPGYKELSNKVDGEKFKFEGCFRNTIPSLFKIKVDCGLYDQVANGEGDEKEKIHTIYSSSLQSLLIFSQVSEQNQIEIHGVKYSKVRFEYKNAVITLPSSIDVVLYNEDNQFLFIESKLTEILDSSKKGKPEVGPGYLSKHENNYDKLGLDFEELKKIGIKVPEGIDQELYKCSASEMKTKIGVLDEEFKNKGKLIIEPIAENTYVYSYGIKQLLAHVIGITNVKTPDSKSDWDLKDLVDFKKTAFLSTYNAFPNFNPKGIKDINKKLIDFKNHECKVAGILKGKGKIPFAIYEPLSYQKIHKDNLEYFSKMPKVVKFYHLDEGDPTECQK